MRPLLFIILVLLSWNLSGNTKDSLFVFEIPSLKLEKVSSPDEYNKSGDNQTGNTGCSLKKPLSVQVKNDEGLLQDSIAVFFSIIRQPQKNKNATLSDTLVYTNQDGIACCSITLGNKVGDYIVSASIINDGINDYQVFTASARRSNWLFFLVVGLMGGLALFLFGMNMMSEGLQKSAGDNMRYILSTLTYNRFIATGVGAFVTMIIQSSSATVVMLVSFVNSRLMKFSQSIGIILGACIGTTITAQLIAFKLTDYSLLLVALGFSLHFFFKNINIRYIGQSILGFGVLFFGMQVMSEAMYPLRSHEPFLEMLVKFENPLLGILTGVLLTALIQSSSAFVGILIIISTQGLISLGAAMPLIIGANIGTVITAFLASIGTNREALKVAIAEGFVKLTGALLTFWWIPAYVTLIESFSPMPETGLNPIQYAADVVPRQIANAHTLFNIILTLALLPFTNLLSRFINWMVKSKQQKDQVELSTKFIDFNLIKTPTLALNLAKQETLSICSHTIAMLDEAWLPLLNHKILHLEKVMEIEGETNFLVKKTNEYLLQISRGNVSEKVVEESFQLLYVIHEFEQIADIISLNMKRRIEKWLQEENVFSEEGKAELETYKEKTRQQLQRTVELFSQVNLEKAWEIKLNQREYLKMSRESEKHHFERLKRQIKESITSSETHIEMIALLNSINEHCNNIAKFILDKNH